MKNILLKLPCEIREQINGLEEKGYQITEITIRSGKKAVIKGKNRYVKLNYFTSVEDVNECLKKLCDLSVYAYMEELKNGFITVKGGHRIGICGTAVIKDNKIYNIKNINSLNIRIAHAIKGCGEAFGINPKSMLVISPPGCGKTTLLRDICRNVGMSHKVSVVDERGEIAGVFEGVPCFDVGDMTDVMSLCKKTDGIEIMLRSMSPEYIVTDEIAAADYESINRAMSYGVNIIASAHGSNIKETVLRLGLQNISKLFNKIVLLSNRNGAGTVEKIVCGGIVE